MDAYGVFHLDGFLNSWHFPIFAMSSTFGPSVCLLGTWGEGRSIQRSPGDEGGGTFGKGSNHWMEEMEVELRRGSWLPFKLIWRICLNVWTRLRGKCIIKKLLPSWQLPSPPKREKESWTRRAHPCYWPSTFSNIPLPRMPRAMFVGGNCGTVFMVQCFLDVYRHI